MRTNQENCKMIFEETGENRTPHRGEWFRASNGVPTKARFSFDVLSFDILEMRIEESGDDR